MSVLVAHFSTAAETALPIMLNAAVKGAVILALTALIVLAMRRASAAARHLAWFLGIVGMLILPVLSAALPGWHVLPNWAKNDSALALSEPPIVGVRPASPDLPAPREFLPPQATVSETSSPVSTPAPAPSPTPLSWQAWIVIAWLAGSMLFFSYVAVGFISLRRLERRCSRITHGSWPILLRELCTQLGVRGRVILLGSPDRAMPMTWGLWRTRLLLPDSATDWSADERRAVLLHELAHARRGDCRTQLVAQLACALYWFNPLVWLAWRRMQSEREQACDDLVLANGTKASAYAEQLLHIATSMPLPRFNAAAIAMARPSKLEGRLQAVLDTNRNRRALTRGLAALAGLVLLIVIIPLAIARAGGGQQAVAPPADQKPSSVWTQVAADPRKQPVSAPTTSAAAAVSSTNSTELRGLVVGPDGKPAAGAQVVPCFSSHETFVDQGIPLQDENEAVFDTDSSGHFMIPPHSNPHLQLDPKVDSRVREILVYHDKGFALATAKQVQVTGRVVLQPWAAVKGTFQVRDTPVKDALIGIQFAPFLFDRPGQRGIWLSYKTRTDSAGRFEFPHVPPLEGFVSQNIVLGRHGRLTRWGDMPAVDVVAESDKTTEVRLGGTGRLVIGHLTAPAGNGKPMDWTWGNVSVARAIEPPYPVDLRWDLVAKQRWYDKWIRTPEGNTYLSKTWASNIATAADGSFRIEDVPPGRYSLTAYIEVPPANDPDGPATEEIASAQMQVTVPPNPSRQPLDLGGIELTRDKPEPRHAPVSTQPASESEPGMRGALSVQFRLVAEGPTTAPSEEMANPNGHPAKLRVLDDVVLDGSAIQSAKAISERGEWAFAFTLTDAAAERWGNFTSQHIGRQVAIIVDGKIITAPTIRSRIGKSSIISGRFTQQQAEQIAAEMNRVAAKVQPTTLPATRPTGSGLQLRWVAQGPTTAPSQAIPNPYPGGDPPSLHVLDKVVIDESDVASARAIHERGQWMVVFTLTDAGAARFERTTSRNIHHQLAIFVDGNLVAAPTVQSTIGRSGEIAGNFTREQAEQIAAEINSAATKQPATEPSPSPSP